MSYSLPESALAWRAKMRAFVDQELMPWEEEAEANGGVLPPERRARQRQAALELGLPGMDAPEDQGGFALSTLEQVMVHADRPSDQWARLVLQRGPELDVRGLHDRLGGLLHRAVDARRAPGGAMTNIC